MKLDKVRSECQQVLRKRGRPPLTPEERARRQECPKRRYDKLQPQGRWRVQTPSAIARKDLVERLDAMAETSNVHQDGFWQKAEDTLGLPREILKRFAKPGERTNLQQ